ncbi:translation initiation factor IF-2 [bacterium]|nr:translation initiation factor IF-2 [bacterium]
MRVYQIAKKHNKKSKEIISILEKEGIKNKKSISGLSDEEIKIIETFLLKKKDEAPKKATKKTVEEEKPVEKKKKTEIKKTVPKEPVAPKETKVVQLEGTEDINILSQKLNVSSADILKYLLMRGVVGNINQSPGKETIKDIGEHFGYTVEIKKFVPPPATPPVASDENLTERAPVVTLMGHVDHGKTTILDAIRKSSIVDKEFGQITQKIGAYKLNLPEGSIVFLDTPGHESFTAMRARGAFITDIVILVVAADDGMKPQTIEAINHAKSANVPIIVAINKVDKPGINIDRVKQQLSEQGLTPADWGGQTEIVNVSAINGQGIDELLEIVLLIGQLLELKANASGNAKGTVIESHMDKAKGPITTVLVQKGKLNVGDFFVIGKTYGKVRAMMDDWNNRLSVAGPSTPVEILGTQAITNPGDKFLVFDTEKAARKYIDDIKAAKPDKVSEVKKITLEDLYDEIQKGSIQEIKLIIKTDYVGSIEAIKDVIEKIPMTEIKITILHSEAGPITESDILLASASNAIVLGFNVPLTKNIEDIARTEKVEIRTYQIIYDLAEDIRNAVEGMLQPELKEVLLGQAMVKQVFNLSDNSSVAGSIVLEGKIVRNSLCRVIRNGAVINQGKINSLKRFKENVKEVKLNTECGIGVDNFNSFEERDIIQSFMNVKTARKL